MSTHLWVIFVAFDGCRRDNSRQRCNQCSKRLAGACCTCAFSVREYMSSRRLGGLAVKVGSTCLKVDRGLVVDDGARDRRGLINSSPYS